jgi:hypothetical protein
MRELKERMRARRERERLEEEREAKELEAMERELQDCEARERETQATRQGTTSGGRALQAPVAECPPLRNSQLSACDADSPTELEIAFISKKEHPLPCLTGFLPCRNLTELFTSTYKACKT